ncbi:hypothetical protein L0Z42_12795 [Burkholderia multivorans]|uniref:hypothetical protein n=1 Tax=Burkholderia multivorans TaxID=87883 RepID=UPI002019F06F|nr:hypothetical protein [Burkholderia multivorans]MCO1371418.1 hypothetical protein [Burkholderia multivorans]MCO1457334.1 hypothetical protein [Burkholderia multivorans]MCO1466320.1 hypothetical protein [Burkholderia multivorans]UQO15988.1 hypothetical protein L0Z02_10240 [Burkholderia multivorans]UQO86645.1 hypothetical protein L0Y86_16220 [Burkholderia multivorans]
MDEREILTDEDLLILWKKANGAHPDWGVFGRMVIDYGREVLAAANRTTPDRDAIIEECASYLDRKWDSAAELLRSLKTTPTAAPREEGNG